MYLTAQGVDALIGAPPPIGTQGLATYDAKTRMLTLRLTEQDQLKAIADRHHFHPDFPSPQAAVASTERRFSHAG